MSHQKSIPTLLSTHKPLHFSDSFAISSGTVTLDLRTSKVLLILHLKTGKNLLPKGRKNIGETLEDAALRETFEETGFTAHLLPLPIPTLATQPSTDVDPDVVRPESTTEPIAVQQRMFKGKLKIIFWFAAAGDSAGVPEERTQQDSERFEPRWVLRQEALEILSFEDDRRVVRRVLDAVDECQGVLDEGGG